MNKNKSIDGLVPRRTKATVSVSHTKKANKTTTRKIAIEDNNEIPIKKTNKKNQQKTSTEDFLKPVQVFDFDEQSGELKESKTIIDKTQKKKAKKHLSKKRKIIICIICIFLVALLGAGFWLYNVLNKITDGQGDILNLFTETYNPLKTDENGRTNILAFGTSGYDMDGSEGDSTHDGAQLTDSIMAISLDQETGDIAMVSLPRDLKTSSTCTATGKINEVYWCNNQDNDDEQAGAKALMSEVNDITDIDFQYYVHINWESLIQIIDILGGITVTLDEDIDDSYYTGAVYQAGIEYNLNGEQALGLARARHGTYNGDFSRGASQQKILIGIKDKISQNSLSLTDLISLANTLGDNLRTNLSIDELKTAAHLATTMSFDSMRQISLIDPEQLVTTGTISGISYVIPSAGINNYTAIQKYITKMLSSDPRIYEDASILVLNGTSTSGIASTEQISLESDGYQNIDIDDAPTIYEEKYTLYALTEETPKTKALLEQRYNVTAKTAAELPAKISTAYDFVIILGGTQTESE